MRSASAPEPPPTEDDVLIARLQDGSEEAFDAVFRRYYAHLVHAAETLLHDRDAAEEVTQEVLLELWRRRSVTTVNTTLRAYLHRAVRNRALNLLRHQEIVRRAQPLFAHMRGSAAPADESAIQHEIRVALSRALESLPPRCREVFELSRFHGLRYAEVASALGISVKTVEVQMGKALRAVRTHLAPWLPDV